MAKIARLLVPLDLGPSSDRTLDYARTVARPFGAALVLMHVVPNPYVKAASDVYLPPPQEFLDELERQARKGLTALMTDADRAEFQAQTVVRVGDPVAEIIGYVSADAGDLIVMGTHGRTGVAHFMLGSVAERVVRTAPCPVLTIR